MAQAIGTRRHTANRSAVMALAAILIAVGIVGVVARVSTNSSPLVIESTTTEPVVLKAHDAAGMGEGRVGGALVDINSISAQTSDSLWAIEARQELAQAKALSPLKARYYPSMGEGFACGCLADIGTVPVTTPIDWATLMRIEENSWGADFALGAVAPMLPPYSEGLGTAN
jgi:hypothetical protein